MVDVFGQVNQLMRAVIEHELGNAVLPTSRSHALGDMGPSSGGSGDWPRSTLRATRRSMSGWSVLDINGNFEFNVPDALKVQAHLRIEGGRCQHAAIRAAARRRAARSPSSR